MPVLFIGLGLYSIGFSISLAAIIITNSKALENQYFAFVDADRISNNLLELLVFNTVMALISGAVTALIWIVRAASWPYFISLFLYEVIRDRDKILQKRRLAVHARER